MSGRMQRVNAAVREVLSESLSGLKDPRVGFVTITGAETAADLRHARVFVSILGNAAQKRRSLAGLQSAHGFLQLALARELHLKHTPTLEFLVDDTAERAMRIEALLHDTPKNEDPE